MKATDLSQYVDNLMKQALYKCDNIQDAEDLVQDTLVTALTAVRGGKEIHNMKAWLSSVLNHKYYDNLRQKYQKNFVCFDMTGEIPVVDNHIDSLEQQEEEAEVRRQVSMLSKMYRDVMVSYYLKGLSIKEIAKNMALPENTVKSRMDIGRKHIRKEMTMEHYTKQSYEPEILWLSNSGRRGMNNEPFSLVKDDKIAMNILIMAYEKPLTISEISKGIGISAAYLEPVINKLVDGELMKQVKDKVYTDFIIYKEEDRIKGLDKQKEFASKNFYKMWDIIEEGLLKLYQKEFYKRQNHRQKTKLEVYFAIRTLLNGILNIRNKVSGNDNWKFEFFPERKNGGKWYAMGSQYTDNYNYDENPISAYTISGERNSGIDKYQNTKSISLHEYNTLLTPTDSVYTSFDVLNNVDKILKMLYAIYSENDKDFDIIGLGSLQDLTHFAQNGYLIKEGDKYLVDIPILNKAERLEFYEISNSFDKKITDDFKDEIEILLKNTRIDIPNHLKSIPEWMRYGGYYLPMMILYKAKEEGVFLKDIAYPIPSTFMVIEDL